MTTEAPTQIDPTLVQAFVGNAHGDLEQVRELLERRAMLDARPELRDAKGPHGIPLSAHATPEVLELLA